jgi:hypothetical protein
MGFELFASVGAEWLWQKHGKSLANKAWGKVKEKWSMFRWQEAENNYRALLREQHSTTRLLGNPRKISVEGIFTDVFVLDKISAIQRFNYEQLRGLPLSQDALNISLKRRPVLKLAVNERRLFVLGKPGAGKTTLLKYITLQACAGKLKRTPVFVSMKDWGDSELELLSFMALQFKICAFPDSEAFIEQLLIKGNVLILFDALDEVSLSRRSALIQTINKFSKLYHDTQIMITCRTAATEYVFDQFTYLEIADFDERQIRLFASKWYQPQPNKLKAFLEEFDKPENARLRDLARTPLLLALLCLAFDETLRFPTRRADLYKEALDALLKRWDSTRGIQRDDIYHSLTLGQKEQLLAHIARQNFEEGNYFIREEVLARQMERFLEQSLNLHNLPQDGESMLRAMEAQHGILVKRAHNIYSFSHLTFQEYFTARFFADYATSDLLGTTISAYMMNSSWREVLLLTASLLEDADAFLDVLLKKAATEGKIDPTCRRLINWTIREATRCKNSGPATRFYLLFNISFRAFRKISSARSDLPGARALQTKISRSLDVCCGISLASAYYLTYHRDIDIRAAKSNAGQITSQLSRDLGIRDIDYPNWDPYITDAEQMAIYMDANELILECLKLAAVSDRAATESRLINVEN